MKYTISKYCVVLFKNINYEYINIKDKNMEFFRINKVDKIVHNEV